MYVISHWEIAICCSYLVDESAHLAAHAHTVEDDSFIACWLRGIHRHIHRVARTGIDLAQGIDEHEHWVRHVQVHRERAIDLDVEQRGLFLFDDIVAHDGRYSALHVLDDLRVVRHDAPPDEYLTAVQPVLAHLGARVVHELRHLLLLHFLLRLHAERCHCDEGEQEGNNGFLVHYSFFSLPFIIYTP